ncbi:hypothetical protein [Mitsuaria sp. GD03876]|uniref:hypothetical protein n=1 Tax=Mitsuaria sp. GD03876 TaxID=2975399 RepID=UPI002446A6DA|nr:hypothetical protein [Mitsuaria sp. GD03876]MDH0867003.1 hypothetical protein [Mitsuaria sp. GD03876]
MSAPARDPARQDPETLAPSPTFEASPSSSPSPSAAVAPSTSPTAWPLPGGDLVWMALVGVGTLVANGTPLANSLSEGLFTTTAYNVLQFGVPAVLLTRGADALVDRGRLPTWAAYPLVVLITILLGVWVIAPALHPVLGKAAWWGPSEDLKLAASTLGWHALGMTVYVQLRQSRRAQARLEALQEAAAARQRQLAAAQLLALQARVDPALLSDQLGVIDAELGHDPPRALARLAMLIELLRAQQPHLEAEVSTLDREVVALRAYACLASPDPVHMGRLHLARLDDAPDWPIAPMVLLPLVRPLLDDAGGTLWGLSLHVGTRDGLDAPGLAQLRLQALGPDAEATRRVAARVPLAELRQRLRAVHGDAAALALVTQDLPLFTLTWPIPTST